MSDKGDEDLFPIEETTKFFRNEHLAYNTRI